MFHDCKNLILHLFNASSAKNSRERITYITFEIFKITYPSLNTASCTAN